ncbi:unnamed protein product [Arabis nemorensis]|uniref:Uncharacterized protein n=1 Tax=Arabis nemorensis TaxID=586526 RepID=A0A565CL84_9BRAS|nr:unnamed protein product [Arabis nemorensis]
MVLKDVERQEIEFVTEILNCLPIANIEQFSPDMIGQAHLVEQVSLGIGMILNIGVVKDMWKSTSLLVRAPRHLALCTIPLHVSSKSI